MTLAQQKLIENYNSLKNKLNSDRIDIIIPFCIYFQSDDEMLYNEFKKVYSLESGLNPKDLINLYAIRYNLNPNQDIETIMNIFLNNTIDEGFSYHLNSSANFSTIMEKGLGLSSIGIKTEERKDYEILQQSIPPETFKILQPFYGEKKGSKVYYSNMPILRASYGRRPEWLRELKKYAPLLESGSKEEILVNNILDKYDRKYDGAKKILFLIPNPYVKKKKEILERYSKKLSPEEIIILFIYRVLNQRDLYTTEHIAPNDILAINLDSFDIYYGLENQSTKQTESSHHRR